MSNGHPELVGAIVSEISSSGPIPFARFMELALYHPEFGYYMREPDYATERIGWRGDFYTSSDVHPIVGRALAVQARQMDELIGSPTPFTIVEMGAGKGLLARHCLETIFSRPDSFASRVRYVLIERSPAMRALQYQNLTPWLKRPGVVTWVDSLDRVPSDSLTGLFFSNELIDAFPVHRIQVTAGRHEELWVDFQNGQFVECLKPLSSEALAHQIGQLNCKWSEGYRTEVNLQALDWMEHVAQRIQRGFVITIDYGHTAQDLYGPDRKEGTFLCYFQHRINENPFVHVGEQDMTAHVDFSSLAAVGQRHGLHLTGFTNQLSFLVGLGAEDMLAELDPDSSAFRAATHLFRTGGMGSTFKILMQHKGVSCPELDGLKFKPFFHEALAAHSAA